MSIGFVVFRRSPAPFVSLPHIYRFVGRHRRDSYRDYDGFVNQYEGPYDFHSEEELPELEKKLRDIKAGGGTKRLSWGLALVVFYASGDEELVKYPDTRAPFRTAAPPPCSGEKKAKCYFRLLYDGDEEVWDGLKLAGAGRYNQCVLDVSSCVWIADLIPLADVCLRLYRSLGCSDRANDDKPVSSCVF